MSNFGKFENGIPNNVKLSGSLRSNRSNITTATARTAKADISQLDTQFQQVIARIRGVPRGTDNECKMWEAVDKLFDIHEVQKAAIEMLARSQGRFQASNESKEAKLIEEKMMELKMKEAHELMERKEEFEALIEQHTEVMTKVQSELMEERTKLVAATEQLEEEKQQRIHAVDALKEVRQWLDEAKEKNKEHENRIKELELEKKAIDDATTDTLRKMENLREDLQARDDEISKQAQQMAKLRDELEARNLDLQRERTENERLHEQMNGLNKAAQAEQDRLKSEIAHLNLEITDLVERSKQWEKFDEICPDHIELEAQLMQKDEVIHQSKKIITMKHADEVSLQGKLREKDAAVRAHTNELSKVEDVLENVVGKPDEEAIGQICTSNTLVACYPDPCPVGRDLHLVVTTRDALGRPVRGVNKEEFSIQRVSMTPHGGTQYGDELYIEDVLDNGRCTSTFHASYPAQQEGRAGFKVKFRGQTFVTTACVPLSSAALKDVTEAEVARKPRITVHCTPSIVAVGETMDVCIALREKDTFLPAKTCDVDVEQFVLSPYTTAQGLKLTNPLQHVKGTPFYTTKVLIQDIQPQGVPKEYVGVEVMLHGGSDAARGSARLIADSRNDGEWDAAATTVSCVPDPATVGELITVTVAARNSYYLPLSLHNAAAAPAPVLMPINSAVQIVQPTIPVGGASQTFVGSFVADEAGRCGVAVNMGGRIVGRSTVVVHPNERFDPSQTTLDVNPPVASKGEPLQVKIVTRDAKGRPTPGPEPTAFQLSKLAGASIVNPMRRVEGSSTEYVCMVKTDPETAYHTAGVSVMFEGFSFSKKVRLTTPGLDVPSVVEPEKPEQPTPPRFSVSFQADPVAPYTEVPIVIAVTQDDPSLDRKLKNLKVPTIVPSHNIESVTAPKPVSGTNGVFKGFAKIGPENGSARVEVEIDGVVYGASTTVQDKPIEGLNDQIERLRGIETRLRDLVRCQDERERSLDERQHNLDGREATLQEKESLAMAAAGLTVADGTGEEEQQPHYLLFGLHLSDGVQYGEQWENIDGAKIVEVIENGPVFNTVAEGATVEQGDIVREVRWEDPDSRYINIKMIRQMDDFRRVCRELAVRYAYHKDAQVPLVDLVITSMATRKTYTITVTPVRTIDPPGRSMGTKRHPSRSTDNITICSSPPRESPRR